jgi:amino acid permease
MVKTAPVGGSRCTTDLWEGELKLSLCGEGGLRRATWQATSALIIADIVGTGILTLPYAFAQLGWTAGLVVLLLCWPLNFFTGFQLNKVHLAFPGSITLGDAACQLGGRLGGLLGYASLYFYLLLLLGDYFIVLSKAMQGMLWDWTLCRPEAGLLAAALLIPSNQFRTLHALSALSIFSFATIVAVCGIYMVDIIAQSPGEPCVGAEVESATGVLALAKVLSKFVFAFSGQKIFLEMQAEMATPEHFIRSMNLAFPLLVLAYGTLASVSLSRCGAHTPSYILDSLGMNWSRTLANALLFAHMTVSYTIAQQVLARALALRWAPGALDKGVRARILWFLLTTYLLGVGWLLGNAIPLFEDFVSLMGALLSTQMTFSFPCVLYLLLRRAGLVQLPRLCDITLLVATWIVLVLNVVLTVCGTASAIMSVVQHAAAGTPPFGCLCTARVCAISTGV